MLFLNLNKYIPIELFSQEVMVQAGDMGRDYEHCMALQRKLDDVDRVDDSRIKAINALADKLIRQGRSDSRNIHQRRENFNNKYVVLHISCSPRFIFFYFLLKLLNKLY